YYNLSRLTIVIVNGRAFQWCAVVNNYRKSAFWLSTVWRLLCLTRAGCHSSLKQSAKLLTNTTCFNTHFLPKEHSEVSIFLKTILIYDIRNTHSFRHRYSLLSISTFALAATSGARATVASLVFIGYLLIHIFNYKEKCASDDDIY
ncbi:MAG: hypothetical protein J1F40_06735, partial [Prevotellaceae bacterium]|nr:hypothetical protein [Prevotellaceae bacterium]